ncbi:MAG: phosphatase PAP2 family protein [Marmoricola sp.]
MKRRAYAAMVMIAVLMGALAFIVSRAVDYPLRDPDGFLGPAWVRLPMLIVAAFITDIVPRTLWRSRGKPGQRVSEARLLIREHWTLDRITLVVLGLVCFYVTYVSYRNLKNFLPFVRARDSRVSGDYELHRLDQWLLFGHDPAILLHNVLGTSVSAHLLSWVYLLFLPMVPISVTIWLVWSRNVSFGYWYVTAQCICWTLGTASYYMIPTLGPNFMFPFIYTDLDSTGVTVLQNALFWGRNAVLSNPLATGVQSVAGFASLHVAVTLLMALVAQYTVRSRVIKVTLWVYMVLVVISTTYFGWHYIADDIAGAVIAFLSFYLGGLATGQRFDEHGRHSHPTTTTSDVPVEVDDA